MTGVGWPSFSSVRSSFLKRNPGCPVLAIFCEGGNDAAATIASDYIAPATPLWSRTPALYHVLVLPPNASSKRRRTRNRFLKILEQVRLRYRLAVVGYVVMPKHLHLLLSKPEMGTPSTVMQVLKQRAARALLRKIKKQNARQGNIFAELPAREPFWQDRFYGFNASLSYSILSSALPLTSGIKMWRAWAEASYVDFSAFSDPTILASVLADGQS